MFTALLAALGISVSSLFGGGAIGIALEVIGMLGKGKSALNLIGQLRAREAERGTFVAPAGATVDMTKPAQPAKPGATQPPPVSQA